MSALTSRIHPWSRWVAQFGHFTGQQAAPLTMLRLQYGYLPARFMYAGAEHRVQRVERSWEEAGWFGQAARRYFRVCCFNGQRYTIAQNLLAGTWQLFAAPKETEGTQPCPNNRSS